MEYIKVIPLTKFQKKRYDTFVEIQANIISNIKGLTGETLVRKSEKNRVDNWPQLNLLQLHSIPDYINGIFLDYSDKENILLGEIENVKSYSKTLETFSIDDDNNLQYWNLNSNPIVARNLTTQDTLTFESHSTPKFTKEGEEEEKAKIIPGTSEQKQQFLEHIESLIYNLTPIVPYPLLTQEQLDSVPNYIDGKELNTINKTQLLFERFLPFSNNKSEDISDLKTYTVSNKGELIRTFESKDKRNRFGNPYKKNISFVRKSDCVYEDKSILQDNSNSSTVSEPRTIYEQTKKNNMTNDKLHLEESLKNDIIRQSPEFLEIFNSLSKEYVEVLKKPDDEAESKELFLKIEKKVYDALEELGMTNQHDDLRFYVSDVFEKGYQEYKIEKSNYVSVIPANEDQKKQYSKYIDGLEFSDMPREEFPSFSKEQLDSVPDTIEETSFSDLQKKLLLLNDTTRSEYGIEYQIDNNNNLIKSFLTVGVDENDIGQETRNLFQNEVSFNKELTLKTINIMSTKVDFDKAKELDVVGFERPLKVYDPVSIMHDGKVLQGKVCGLPLNGEIIVSILNSKETNELIVSPKDQAKLVPMFILNKEEKMVYLKFSYNETIAALNNKSDINLKQDKDLKSPIFNLMLGNKTDVIPFEKNIDNKMAPVEGRLELRRKAGTGEAYVHGEVKHKELNLSLPIYGLQLNDKQKEDLVNKKDIGLVQGFKSNEGKEFALWVSLDEKLNKVVTAPERSININMIFGVKTTEEQRNQIKNGEGAVLEIKGKEYLFTASAAATKADGLKSNAIEKPKDLKEKKSQEINKEEKKSKSKGLRI